MEVGALSHALGVEIKGVDLGLPLPAGTTALLARLFAEHSLLLFRDQELSEGDQLRFVASLGPVSDTLSPPAPDNWIGTGYYLSSEYADGQGELRLHSDHCFLDQPLRGISLYAEAVPASGGEALFASAVAAARNLPPDLARSLAGLVAVQTLRRPGASRRRNARPASARQPGRRASGALGSSCHRVASPLREPVDDNRGPRHRAIRGPIPP